jgi:hypothetical protein
MTFYGINEKIYFDDNNKIGIGVTNPSTNFHINSTDGIVIPIGTNAQRVDVTGAIRYNTDNSTFEGFKGTWGSLGGVIDVDQDTYVSAETSAGTDNDDLKFFTAGTERMKIDSNGNTTINSDLIVDTNLLFVDASSNLVNVNGELDIWGKARFESAASYIESGVLSLSNTLNGPIIDSTGTDIRLSPNNTHTGVLTININGNVGIGDTSPSYKLDVNGTGRFTGNLTCDSDFIVDTDKFFVDQSSGNVGIGINEPLALLEIRGDPTNTNQPTGIDISGNVQDTHTGLFLDGKGNAVNEKFGMQFAGWRGYGHSGIFGVMDLSSGKTTGDITFDFRAVHTDTEFTERMRITHEGNVGIGTDDPGHKLHIWGDSGDVGIKIQADAGNDDENDNPYLELSQDGDTIKMRLGIESNTSGQAFTGSIENHAFINCTDIAQHNNGFQIATNGIARMTFEYGGNVGIGDTTPSYKLDVNGTGRFTGNLTCDSDFIVDTDKFFVDQSTGKVGIGTTTPGSTLDVYGSSAAIDISAISPKLHFSTIGTPRTSNIRYDAGSATAESQALRFNVSDSTTTGTIETLTLLGNGNVGIGNTSPSNGKLEINGTSGSTNLGAYSYGELTTSGTSLGTVKTGASYSIYASGPIAASEFNAVSDVRVKNIKEIRNNKKDMETLEQMNVYEFDYIDKLNYGTKDKIGFIAQDLEKLNNNLINYSKNYIPNIFKTFKLINKNKIILDKEYDLEVNDMLKIEITVYSQKIMIEKKILEKNNNEIIIEIIELIEGEDIFVYGKKVDDFRTVNFEQIIGMNVSSIKYLYNEIKEIKENQEKLYNLIKNKLNI